MMKLNIQLFGSGSFDLSEGKGSGSNYLYGNIEYEYTTGTSEQNYSVVTARIYARRNGSTPTSGKSWSGSISIGSYATQDISFSSSISVGSSWRLMASVSANVPHNDDGSKKVTISGSVRGPSGTTLANAISSGNKEITLDTIPRASTFNSITQSFISTGTFTPSITKKSATFYDRLTISYGGVTIKTINNVTNQAYSFTTNELNTLYSLFGNNLALSLTFTLQTFSNSSYTTQIGNSSVKTSVCNLPSYTLQWGTRSVTDSVTTYNTYKPTSSTFINGLSKPTFTFSASSSTGTDYGNTIGYKLNGTNVTSPYTQQTYNGETYTIVASDGRTSKDITYTYPMTSVAYSSPQITSLQVVRPTATGTTASVNATIKYYDGNGLTNLLTRGLTLTYQEQGGTSHTKTLSNFTIQSETTTNHITTLIISGTIDALNYQKNMTYSMVFTDKIGRTATNGGTLNQGVPCWNAYQDSNFTNIFRVNGKAKSSEFDGNLVGNVTGNVTGTLTGNASTSTRTYYANTLEAHDGRLTSANIPHYYSNDKAHLKLLISSGAMTTGKPMGDGYILACNWDNAGQHAGQLYMPNGNGGSVQYRAEYNGSWGSWDTLYRVKVLYDNSNGSNGTITLSESVTNFSYLEIYYRTNDWIHNMTKIKALDELDFTLEATLQGYNNTWINWGAGKTSGTTITRSASKIIRFDSNATIAYLDNATNIYITRVIGYR